MRKTIASVRPTIYCKQCTRHDIHEPDLDELLALLYREGYHWADKNHNEYNIYRVKCEGEIGVGVSAAEGEAVITDLRHPDADGFWLDDKNVKFVTMTYNETMRASKRRARELERGIKIPKK